MKPQDLIFLGIFFVLLVFRKSHWFVYTALLLFAAAAVLFSQWVFFTAERFTWYAALCIAVAVWLERRAMKGQNA